MRVLRLGATLAVIMACAGLGAAEAPEGFEPLGLAPASAAVHPLAGIADATDDAQWLSRAREAARERESSGPVILEAMAADGQRLSFRYRVVDLPQSRRMNIPLAVPAGGFTTMTLTDCRVVDPARTADGEATWTECTPPLASFEGSGFVRNVAVGNFVLNFTTQQLAAGHWQEGTVHLFFGQPAESAGQATPWAEGEARGPVRGALERLVRNPGHIGTFALGEAKDVPGGVELPDYPTTGSAFRIRVHVERDGLYRITGAELASAGVNIGDTPPEALRLTLEGEAVPLTAIRALGAAANMIAEGDAFVFYAKENSSRFSRTNVHWLTADPVGEAVEATPLPAPVASMPTADAVVFAETATVEEDLSVEIENDQFLSILGFEWVWQRLTPDKPVTVEFDLPGLPRQGAGVEAVLKLHSGNRNAQETGWLRTTVNGGRSEVTTITAGSPMAIPLAVAAGELKESGNTLAISLETTGPGGLEADPARRLQLHLDKLEVKYPRLYALQQGGLEFASPLADGTYLSSVTTSPRNVMYRIAAPRNPPVDLMVVDITDTATAMARPSVVAGPGASAGSVIEFSAFEPGPRRYLLATASSASTVTLESVAGRPDLRSADNRADFVIIAHREFAGAMEAFAERKKAEGFEPQIVDIHDIYDQFSMGQHTPVAVRSFLRHAAATWQGTNRAPAATRVLLVGDATSAYRNEFRNDVVNYVPSHSEATVPGAPPAHASDSWFTRIFGGDDLCDVIIGRLSVNNLKDLKTILAKMEEYGEAKPGPWTNTLGFVADQNDFEDAVEQIMEHHVPARFFMKRVFLRDEPWIDNYYFPEEIADAKKAKVSPEATAKILHMFNDGAAVITYFGHGSPNIWSNERIWFGGDSENSDNLLLSNRARLPFVVTMTCNSGAIDYPMPRWNVNISEDMMRVPNGGAIACFAPSGPGVTANHQAYTEELMASLLGGGDEPLGDRLLLAGWRYLLRGQPAEVHRMFILMGDPTLRLLMPEAGDIDLSVRPDGMAVAGCFDEGTAHYQAVVAGKTFEASDITTVAAGVTEIPVPEFAREADAGSRVAVMARRGQDDGESDGLPILGKAPIELASWALGSPVAAAEGEKVECRLHFTNASQAPLRGVSIQLSEPGGRKFATESIDMVPGESCERILELEPPGGVTRWAASALVGSREFPLEPRQPIVTAAALGDGAPVGVDAESIDVVYQTAVTTAGVQAVVRFDVYNLTGSTVSDLSVALLGRERTPLQETLSSIPSMAPGGRSTQMLRLERPVEGPAVEELTIAFDPYGGVAGSGKWARPKVEVGRGMMADLVIPEDGISAEPPSPTDGETVFFQVTVENRGKSTVRLVRVDAMDVTTTGGGRLESRVMRPDPGATLGPGASATKRLRWDPFRNAGVQRILFTAVSYDGQVADANPADNERVFELKVRAKHQLKRAGLTVPPPSAEDRQKRQVRVVARVRNDGESAAQGVKVVFYPAEHHGSAEHAVGEVVIGEIEPGTTAEASIVYQLRPGDEKKPYLKFSFDPFLKGSLQRLPPEETP